MQAQENTSEYQELFTTDPLHFWTSIGYRSTRKRLDQDCERLVMETPSGESFLEDYTQMCIHYVATKGVYAHEPYDEEEARSCMGCMADFETAHDYAVSVGLIQPPQDTQHKMDKDVNPIGVPRKLFTLVPYGSTTSPQDYMMRLGMSGWVAPPEGIGGDELELDTKEAGLPIPEGCSSMTKISDQDGQSSPGGV